MSYRIGQDEAAAAELSRVIREQIDKALAELTDRDLPRAEVVHQVRKRCKKIRAVLRLVRQQLGDYTERNHLFRDLARSLSAARDTAAVIETFDDLIATFKKPLDTESAAAVRQGLAAQRDDVVQERVDIDRRLAEAYETLEAARGDYEAPLFEGSGFDALAAGLGKTYKRAQRAMDEAYDQPSTEAFHEWRKRVKYDWYHTRLLQDAWPRVMKARRKALKRLADLLGDEHDLAVLAELLGEDPERFGGQRQVQAMLGVIDRRRNELRRKARPLGKKAFAEKRKRLVKRIGKYWRAEKDA